jgi:hypothetical protein
MKVSKCLMQVVPTHLEGEPRQVHPVRAAQRRNVEEYYVIPQHPFVPGHRVRDESWRWKQQFAFRFGHLRWFSRYLFEFIS